ncbi:NlpC/P60 family protein [Streptomyces sp. NPDC094038]|uniref:C40 family peptidase n=1 Tax=Streptomyces sp. NPDC094038 TaxID=3366055 RepID=UPI003808D355
MAPESRDEVRQRIDSLYDQAENATGNYNATRAMSGGSRSRGVPLFKRSRRDDPGLDNIAREWFEGARSRLGPSVPAALPTDRQPNRPGPRRPVSAMAADLLGQLEDSGPARLELTAGPSAQSEIEVVRELPSRPRLELTAGPAAAVPAGPSGAPRALPAAGPQQPTPGASKTRNQLKLAKAREVLSQRTGQRAIAALDPAPVPVQIPVAQAAPPAPSPWPTPEAQAPAQPWQAPPVGIPNQRTGSGSFRADSRAATRALPAVTETGGIPIVSPSDTGTFRIMTPGGADSAPTRAAADSTGFRVMTPGGADSTPPRAAADSTNFRVMTPGSADSTPPRAAADSTGFRVMTPGGSGGGTYQTGPAVDAGAAQAPAPSPGDSGSFRIMTPGATGSFPMPTPADAGTFPAADPLGANAFPTADPMASTSVFPTADPMARTSVFPTADPMARTSVFPTADPMNGGGGFPTAAPAAPPAAPAPMDLGGYRVMSPNAPAAYADIPPAAADTAYANGAYPAAPPVAPAAPMATMPPAAPFAAAPAADMYGTYAAGMQPAEGAYAYAATTAMPTAMAAPAAAMPAPMTMPMPMAAPMQAPMAAPPAPAAPAMPAMPTAMTAPPEAMTAAAPAMAMPMAAPAPAAPVFTAPLPTTPLPTAPAQVAAPVPAPAAPAPGAYADPAAFVQPGAGAEPGKAMKALAFAREQIGRPCVWGATGPGAYDASSLTQAAWRAAGVSLPRTAAEQTLAGTLITLAAVEPGDLVFFFDDDSHVGIYAGGGAMVHAPSPGALIREESIYNAGESAIHRVIRPA